MEMTPLNNNETLDSIMDEAVGVTDQNIESERSIKDMLIVSEDTDMIRTRFNSATWFEDIKQTTIRIVGLGGIGSWTAFLASKLGLKNMLLHDNDVVEISNIGGQLYGMNDVGKPKCACIGNKLRDNDFYNYSINDLYVNEDVMNSLRFRENIMISCVDNMITRKLLFNKFKEKDNIHLFIDGRMSAECFQIFTIDKQDSHSMKVYEKDYLFSDSEADSDVCSYKQTSFVSNMIASYIINIIVNYTANKQESCFRPIPAFVEYDAVTMNIKIHNTL